MKNSHNLPEADTVPLKLYIQDAIAQLILGHLPNAEKFPFMLHEIGIEDSTTRPRYTQLANIFILPLIKETRAALKKAGEEAVWNEWISDFNTFMTLIGKEKINLHSTLASFNKWFVEQVMPNTPFRQHFADKTKIGETLSISDQLMQKYSDYTYLLTTSGKASVLIDNEKRAEAWKDTTPVKHHYTLLSHTDAHVVASNIPFVKLNAKGDYVDTNIHKEWQSSSTRKDLTGITFDPSTTERIVHDEFNIWRGWDFEPVESDADLPFWELVLDVLCDGNVEYFDFVRKWLAHMVQRPAQRPLCAIGISGPQGVGKSLFVKVVGGLMHSSHYNPNVAMKAIAGDQQGRDLEGVLLAYLDEASWGGDKLSTGALKKAITGETDRINEKFVPAYNVPTYKRIVFSSNENYYYHADADDRRLLPLEIDRKKAKKSNEFFQSIINGQELRPEVQQALLYSLMNEDIEGWIPHEALQQLKIVTGGIMQERSMTNVQRWMFDAIKNRSFEARLPDGTVVMHNTGGVSVAELQLSYKTFCEHDSFDRTRQVNLSAAEPKQFLVSVFGGDSKPLKRAGQLLRAYKIDWNIMQQNFQSGFKWKLQWNEAAQPTQSGTLIMEGEEVL